LVLFAAEGGFRFGTTIDGAWGSGQTAVDLNVNRIAGGDRGAPTARQPRNYYGFE
jgi:hypothetical protein